MKPNRISPGLVFVIALCAACNAPPFVGSNDALPSDPDAAAARDATAHADDAAPAADAGASADDDAATHPDAQAGHPDAQGVQNDDAQAGQPDATTSTGLEPGPGDLVFVEVQGNPQNTVDTDAEYFEIINVSGRTLDLQGCRLTHLVWLGAGMAPVRSVGNHLINRSVMIAPGDRALLTRSSGGFFGGATRDYVYGGFELGNGNTDNNRVRLMIPGWSGTEPPDALDVVDEIVIPAGTFDNPFRGRAWQLDPAHVASPTAAANDDPASWCYAAADNSLAYWMSNWGTPRAPNVCP